MAQRAHNSTRYLASGLCTRRQFLNRFGMGFGTLGLAGLLSPEVLSATDLSRATTEGGTAANLLPKQPHFAPRAKRVIHLFMNGGPSAMDTFDPKPKLAEYAGKTVKELAGESGSGLIMASPFKFQKHGKCGLDVSELFPHIAKRADDLCVIRSMHGDEMNHEPGIAFMNCGASFLSRPTLGAWVSYGLGTENQNLPAYLSLCPTGMPIGLNENWRSSFLPGIYQGTHVNTEHSRPDEFIENLKNHYTGMPEQRRQLDLLQQLSALQQKDRERDAQLDARIQSFELAYRMQMDATDAFDLSQEPQHVRDLYGEGVQSRQLIIARRFLERGVRFIQLWYGAGMPWDSHQEINTLHPKLCKDVDQPIAAFLTDLKLRGMLDDTLVIWGGEFGRTSSTGDPNATGRSHNPFGFTVWLAGGGTRGGYVHGATDEFGAKAVTDKVHVHDLHATILAACGLDHERLTYRYSGRDFRLTDVKGRVVNEIFA